MRQAANNTCFSFALERMGKRRICYEKISVIFTVFLALPVSAPAQEGSSTGNDYIEYCISPPSIDYQGEALDLMEELRSGICSASISIARQNSCIPSEVSDEQLSRIMGGFIMAHPAKQHLEMAELAKLATQEDFPCSAQ